MELKPGDYVRCINNQECSETLTLNKIYKIVNVGVIFQIPVYSIVNDLGNHGEYIRNRFILAEDYILKEIWKD